MQFSELKELRITKIAMITAVIVTVVLLLTRTPFWNYVSLTLTPLVYAFVVAYILDYIVRFFELKLKFPRGVSILAAILIFIGSFIMLGLFIIPSAYEAFRSLLDVVSKLDFNYHRFLELKFNNETLEAIRSGVISQLEPALQRMAHSLANHALTLLTEARKILSSLISAFVIFSISIYMLIEKKDLVARIKRFISAYTSTKHQEFIFKTAKLSDQLFKNFVVGKIIDSIIIGILSYVLLSVLGFQYPVLISLIIGITNVIPYFGPFIGAVPAAAITYIANIDQPINVLWILLLVLAIQQLDGLVIGPMILGDTIGVSAFWIITSVTIGGAVAGVIGMFIGVPFVVLVKQLIEEDVDKKLHQKGIEHLEVSNLKVKRK